MNEKIDSEEIYRQVFDPMEITYFSYAMTFYIDSKTKYYRVRYGKGYYQKSKSIKGMEWRVSCREKAWRVKPIKLKQSQRASIIRMCMKLMSEKGITLDGIKPLLEK